jgi:UDP-N-acetylmuramate dehydrogenase
MIQENVSLKPYNTFGVEAQTRYFAQANTLEDLTTILAWYRTQKQPPLLLLGGGSNLLFTQDWPGLVLKLDFKEKSVVREDDQSVLIKAEAGEDWHDFVLKTLELGYYGLENLSLIPGSVGASPLQNIGAYGVEIKDVFYALEALNLVTGEERTFTTEACEFGYRDSVFKKAEKGKWIIVSVTFKLSKIPQVKIEYGTIKTVLEAHKITAPTPLQVSQAVTAIRQAKLPDPKVLGSAGSFFKNPIISSKALARLQKEYPDIPNFLVTDSTSKVPAAWLIEKAGWKGKTFGNYGVHKEQALVLVNYGGASGADIWKLAQDIMESVSHKFSITLVPEVNVI